MTGIGRALVEVLRAIAVVRCDLEVVVYANSDNDELLDALSDTRVDVKICPISKNRPILNLLYNALIFPFLALRENADVVYIANFFPVLLTFRPLVAVIHDMIEFREKAKFSKLRTLYRHLIVPRMARIAKCVLCDSKHSKDDIVDLCRIPPEKIVVAYNACTTRSSEMVESDVPGIAPPYVLFVGTVDYPGKNVYNCIRAFEAVKPFYRHLRFVVCGMPGKGYDTIEAYVRASPHRADILLMGYVPDAQLVKIYTQATLLAFVSYYEGFGLPILEAMSYGVPVVTSTRSSLPEVAGDAALLCDPDSVNEIKEAMFRILGDDSLRCELIRKGYENVKRFSWTRTAEITVEALESATQREREGV